MFFPMTVGPFALEHSEKATRALQDMCGNLVPSSAFGCVSLEPEKLGLDEDGAGCVQMIRCMRSPLSPVTAPTEARGGAKIPEQAVSYAFVYPTFKRVGHGTSLEHLFLEYGGFLYFGQDNQLISAVAFVLQKELGTIDSGGLHFGRAQVFPKKFAETLTKAGRFQDVTLQLIRSKGAERFAWIWPKEFQGLAVGDGGCFVFHFGGDKYRYYPMVTTPIFTPKLVEMSLAHDPTTHEAWVVVRREGAPHDVEEVRAFDKTKSLAQNMGRPEDDKELSRARVAACLDDSLAAPLSYYQWQRSAEAGTHEAPWILTIRKKRKLGGCFGGIACFSFLR